MQYNLPWHTKLADPMIKEKPGGPFGVYGSSAGDKPHKLAQPVDNGEDGIKPSWCWWKMGDPVHSNLLKQPRRRWKRLKQSNWYLSGVLVSLANRTLTTEALDIFG